MAPCLAPQSKRGHDGRYVIASELVGDTGFEPVTSSVSGKRAPTAPIARDFKFEVGTGFEPVYTALQAVASPLGHPTEARNSRRGFPFPSGRRDSNPRPSPWQGDALPAALRPHCYRLFRSAVCRSAAFPACPRCFPLTDENISRHRPTVPTRGSPRRVCPGQGRFARRGRFCGRW